MNKNPFEYLSGIIQSLASDKKRIGFLFGAGTSFAHKDETAIYIPSVSVLTKNILETINSDEVYFKDSIKSILQNIENPNIEKILDLVEKKIEAVGSDKLNGLNHEEFIQLRKIILKQIFKYVSVINSETPKEELMKLPHYEFAKWIAKAERKYPIEIFTTNYDYMFECAFEVNDVPYFDGFSGSLSPFFHSISVEDFSYLPKETKLWKIHGSLGWKVKDDKVIRCKSNLDNDELLIYPSSLKYANSKKMPYISLVDRLCNFMQQDDSILIVLGYSFGDEHINERIITTLKKSRNSHVFVFLYDKRTEGEDTIYELETDLKYERIAIQSSRISFLGMKSAIIGGIKYKWDFDSSTTEIHDEFGSLISLNTDNSFNELLIPDFIKFVDFISLMMNDAILEDISHE